MRTSFSTHKNVFACGSNIACVQLWICGRGFESWYEALYKRLLFPFNFCLRFGLFCPIFFICVRHHCVLLRHSSPPLIRLHQKRLIFGPRLKVCIYLDPEQLIFDGIICARRVSSVRRWALFQLVLALLPEGTLYVRITHQNLEPVLEVLGVGGVAGGHVLKRGEAEASVEVLVQGVHGDLEVNDAVHMLLELRQHHVLRRITPWYDSVRHAKYGTTKGDANLDTTILVELIGQGTRLLLYSTYKKNMTYSNSKRFVPTTG